MLIYNERTEIIWYSHLNCYIFSTLLKVWFEPFGFRTSQVTTKRGRIKVTRYSEDDNTWCSRTICKRIIRL